MGININNYTTTKSGIMELYIVNFYDHNESGNVEHTEMYSTWKAAKRRFNKLKNKLNCSS